MSGHRTIIPKQNSKVVEEPVLRNAPEHDWKVKMVADCGGVTKPAVHSQCVGLFKGKVLRTRQGLQLT